MNKEAARAADQDAFTDITSDVDQLLRDPSIAPDVARIRELMAEADRVHAMSLSMVREAAGLTQTQLAATLRVTQAAVARTEKRGDVLLSTLASYLQAAGARATILVTLSNGKVARIALDEAAARRPSASVEADALTEEDSSG